jgi:hypothetical protein
MSSPRASLDDVPALGTRCSGSGQPAPLERLPQGPRGRAGRCPVCGRLYGRNRRTGTIYPHPQPDQPTAAPVLPDQGRRVDAPVPRVASEESLSRVASEEPEHPEEPDEPATVPTGILMCAECTILIGPGYIETEPFPHPHGPGVVCRACLESLERRARRAAAPPPAPAPLAAGSRRLR